MTIKIPKTKLYYSLTSSIGCQGNYAWSITPRPTRCRGTRPLSNTSLVTTEEPPQPFPTSPHPKALLTAITSCHLLTFLRLKSLANSHYSFEKYSCCFPNHSMVHFPAPCRLAINLYLLTPWIAEDFLNLLNQIELKNFLNQNLIKNINLETNIDWLMP